MRECCRLYVRQGWGLAREWFLTAVAPPPIEYERSWRGRRNYLGCVVWALGLNLRILTGIGFKYHDQAWKRCPWHDSPEWGIDGYKNYLAVMELAGQPGFDGRLGPIQIDPAYARTTVQEKK